MNLAGFKKLKEDKKTVTMAHPEGHEIKIFKAKLPMIQRKQIEKLPLAEGGDVQKMESKDDSMGSEQSTWEKVNEALDKTPRMQMIHNMADGGDTAATAINNFVDQDKGESIPQGTPAPEVADPALSPSAFSAAESDQRDFLAGKEPVSPEAPPPPPAPIKSDNTVPAPASIPDSTAGLPNASLGDVYGKSLAAIQQKSKAEADLAANTANVEAQNQSEIKQAQQNWLQSSAKMNDQISNALQDVKNGHINPNHYLENMGVGGKIATGIGLLLGGFSGGLNRTGVNPAAEWLGAQINRDVDAQKANQNTKLNVYNGYLDQYKNAAVAEQMTRATQMGIYASKIRQAAAQAGTPLAIANGNLAASELEQKMIPLVQNAHLTAQLAAFNGGAAGGGRGLASPGAGSAAAPGGTENQYRVVLNAAQKINPETYKDQQEKYIPGVGVASRPVAQPDRERLSRLNALIPLIDKAVADQEHFGRLGAKISLHPVADQAAAASDFNALHVQLNQLTGLNRLNDSEYKNYGDQIGNIGGFNLGGGNLETIKNLRNQAETDRNSQMESMGITPFAGALRPSGLDTRGQQNLSTFMKNNPGVDQGKAISVLKSKGLL